MLTLAPLLEESKLRRKAVHFLGESLEPALEALERALQLASGQSVSLDTPSNFVLAYPGEWLPRGCDEEAFNSLSSPDDAGLTALLGEQLCLAWSEAQGLPVTVLRYFGAYGPGCLPSRAATLLEAAVAGQPLPGCDPEAQVSWLHRDDLLHAIDLAAESPRCQGEVISVSAPPVSECELARLVWGLAGRPFPSCAHAHCTSSSPTAATPDLSKAAHLLQFRPRVPLSRGLAEAIALETSRV